MRSSTTRFRKSEQIAILIFTSLLFILFLSSILLENREATKWNTIHHADDTALEKSHILTTKRTLTPLPADPNIASLRQLQRIGISEEASKGILAYRKTGGVFASPSDLKKVKMLSLEEYEKARPYIRIIKPPKKEKKLIRQKVKIIRDINRMNTNDWQQLVKISKEDAARIITFRNQLGGFYSVKQIKEVINIPTTLSQKIANLTCDTTRIATIRVKNASLQQLKNHPYISDNIAIALYQLAQKKSNESEYTNMLYKKLKSKDAQKIHRYLNFGQYQ